MSDEELMGALESLDNEWQDVPAAEYEELPDGQYTGTLQMAVERSKSSTNRLQVKTVAKVTGPKFIGRLVFDYQGLEHQDSKTQREQLGRVKGMFKRWGYEDIHSLQLLPALCQDMTAREVEFTLKKGSDGRQRVYWGNVVRREVQEA